MKFLSNTNHRIVQSCLGLLAIICANSGTNTFAKTTSQEELPQISNNSPSKNGSEHLKLLHAEPKSLSAQKLSSSSFPDEAEIYCGTNQCIFGLTRGLVVGGSGVAMLTSPLQQYLDPNWVSGTLSIIDVYGGFQITRDIQNKNFMNAQIGYRRLSFDDGANTIVTQGLTTAVHYSQNITPIYTQGIEFSGFFVFGNASLTNSSRLNANSPGHNQLNNSASYFYRVSQKYPTAHVHLPADLELMNWNHSQTNLPMPIHGYLQADPFYIQNNLSFVENNISIQKTEQNFGVRVSAIGSYESTEEKEKTGRYALKAQAGLEIATSSFSTKSSGNASLSLPSRAAASPFMELAGSWQF